MTPDEARERVARGFALLDERKPGWREKVDPRTLEMRAICGCVLGHVYGDYHEGAKRLGLSRSDRVAHGFNGERERSADYDVLQDAWLEQLGGTSVAEVPILRPEGEQR